MHEMDCYKNKNKKREYKIDKKINGLVYECGEMPKGKRVEEKCGGFGGNSGMHSYGLFMTGLGKWV